MDRASHPKNLGAVAEADRRVEKSAVAALLLWYTSYIRWAAPEKFDIHACRLQQALFR